MPSPQGYGFSSTSTQAMLVTKGAGAQLRPMWFWQPSIFIIKKLFCQLPPVTSGVDGAILELLEVRYWTRACCEASSKAILGEPMLKANPVVSGVWWHPLPPLHASNRIGLMSVLKLTAVVRSAPVTSGGHVLVGSQNE